MKRFLPPSVIGISVLFISALHFLTPIDSLVLHQVYQRLYYIPLILAALWYGWRGGLVTAAFVSISYLPHIALHWQHQNFDYALNQYAEIAMFFVIGAITGWLGDQRRREAKRAERINAELQQAYTDLRQTVTQLLQAERLSSLAEIASGVVHEVRNPLGAIKGAVEILEDELSENSPRREFALIAKAEVERIDRLIQEFLHFARSKEPDKKLININNVIDSIRLIIEKQAAEQKVEIQEELTEDLPLLTADDEQIKQVLLNLALNSLQAMPNGGVLVLRTMEKNGAIVIETEDTGGGLDEKIRPKIFDPFFSTKESGLGLGLSVALKIVQQHDGQIVADNTKKGTKFRIVLPIKSLNGHSTTKQ